MTEKLEKTHQHFTAAISKRFYDKLDNHILIVKKLFRPGYTKQSWITEAIQEKLERERNELKTHKDKRITFKIDLLSHKQLEQKLEEIRSLRKGYSKKQWLIEAIEEKLNRKR